MWVCASDYADDLRIGPEILKTTVETYRKLRNTLRWMLGSLGAFPRGRARRAGEDAGARAADAASARRARPARSGRPTPTSTTSASSPRSTRFMTVDLSAFYFDIRKDTLYCDPISSQKRRACLTVLDHLFRATVTWLAPMLPFTAEEAWLSRYPSEDGSVHLRAVPAGAGAMARRRAGREVAQGAHRAPRRHRRARDRARSQAHRLVAGSRSDRARVRPRPVRGAGRHRPRGSLHHLGRDAGLGRRPGRPRSGCPT